MKEANQPHDTFFHLAFSQVGNARDLLRNALPKSILDRLDLSFLEISKESYVDQWLGTHQSDILIRTRYQTKPIFIYILVEHKSYPYRWTVLKLLAYMVRIWEKLLAQNKSLKSLPPIVPIIFYHGSRRWKFPLDFPSYVALPEEFSAFVPDFRSILFNLQELQDEDLQGADLFQASIKAFKYAFKRMRPHLGQILHHASAFRIDEGKRSFLEGLLKYILQVGRDIRRTDVVEELRKAGRAQAGEVYMTIAEQLRAEGKAEGKAEGQREGRILAKQQDLTNLLVKKFGSMGNAVKRKIADCREIGKLEQAIVRVLDTESMDQILEILE
jgi:predicted transposase/invertase (TIGR01784 family)